MTRTILTSVTALIVFGAGILTGIGVSPNVACAAASEKIVRVLEIPDEEAGYEVTLPDHVSSSQARLLRMAYDTALGDGHAHPQLLQGIILQETLAGQLASYKVAGQEAGLKPLQRYYGVAQVKLAAARDVLDRFPRMWDQFHFQTRTDDEVVAKLIESDSFNIAIASKYLLILKDHGYRSPGAQAVAYNKGPGGAAGVVVSANPYAIGVYKHISRLAPIVSAVYHPRFVDPAPVILLSRRG